MAVLTLPQASKPMIAVNVAVFVWAAYLVFGSEQAAPPLVLAAFLLSGFLADMFTGMMHFGFDYVFPDRMPILGPIAVEFREHHDAPSLDPKDYIVNFTKGAYGSLPFCLIVIALAWDAPQGGMGFFWECTLLFMSAWGFFFHQIHSYSHMGACLKPEEFNARLMEIRKLDGIENQKREFAQLFGDAPIPPAIRLLQKLRLILNPDTHNLHHISFESDFSSVNGWSDPLMNWLYGPIARRRKKERGPGLWAVAPTATNDR